MAHRNASTPIPWMRDENGLDVRVQALEAKALDTKTIWERALTEILEVRKGVEDLIRKIDVLSQDVLQVRADQV